jgi:colanic acid biosynthesis glycosyl transferase WcaI
VKQGERWLILSQYYAPELGAPQLRLRALARELQRHGIQVEVLTGMPNYPAGVTLPEYRGRWRMREKIDDVIVRRTWLYAATGRSGSVRLANYLSFTATALVAALLGRKPNCLFVESQPLSLGVVALLMKRLRGVPYIYNVPDLQVDVAREMRFVRNKSMLSVMTKLEDLFLKQSWKVSTVTNGFIEHFQSRGIPRSQITFLPNGADTDFLLPLPPDEELLERWALHGKKTFVYVGTHAYYHGLETLIEAAVLLQRREDIAFLLIGDGPTREPMKELARKRGLTNVTFGASPYEEMARCYSIAYASLAVLKDIEVASKMRLSKVFPALSCGVPVIFSGAGETPELLEQHGAGVGVRAEDAASLARTIEELAADPGRRDAMGRAARELAEKRFSWHAIVQRWLEELGYAGDSSQDAGPEREAVELERSFVNRKPLF